MDQFICCRKWNHVAQRRMQWVIKRHHFFHFKVCCQKVESCRDYWNNTPDWPSKAYQLFHPSQGKWCQYLIWWSNQKVCIAGEMLGGILMPRNAALWPIILRYLLIWYLPCIQIQGNTFVLNRDCFADRENIFLKIYYHSQFIHSKQCCQKYVLHELWIWILLASCRTELSSLALQTYLKY